MKKDIIFDPDPRNIDLTKRTIGISEEKYLEARCRNIAIQLGNKQDGYIIGDPNIGRLLKQNDENDIYRLYLIIDGKPFLCKEFKDTNDIIEICNDVEENFYKIKGRITNETNHK